MSRIVRLSVALVIALMMVIAFAGAALAFNPPDKNDASGLCGTVNFPAFNKAGFAPMAGFVGPWNAVSPFNPSPQGAPIDFGPMPDCGPRGG